MSPYEPTIIVQREQDAKARSCFWPRWRMLSALLVAQSERHQLFISQAQPPSHTFTGAGLQWALTYQSVQHFAEVDGMDPPARLSIERCALHVSLGWSLDFWTSGCHISFSPWEPGRVPEVFSHWLGSCLHPGSQPAMGLTSNIPATQRCSLLCHTHIQNLLDSSWIKFQFSISKCRCKWSVVWTRLGTVHKRISSKKIKKRWIPIKKRWIPQLTPLQENILNRNKDEG